MTSIYVDVLHRMMDRLSSKIFLSFNLICLSAAIALTAYWIYVYTLNEDLVTVDYRKYYDREKDVFPSLSLCLKNSISDQKIKDRNTSINTSVYLNFLKGDVFDPEMLLIHFPTVIKNMTDYIEDDFIRYRNGTIFAVHPAYQNDSAFGDNFSTDYKKRIISSNYAFFLYSSFFVCYDLSTPHDRNINEFYYRIDSSIFPSGIRPSSYGLVIVLHYPNQLLIAGNREHKWPQPRNQDDSYEMKFHVNAVEVLRRRQKRGRPCNQNWEDHDRVIKNKHTNSVGCILPYLDKIDGVPLCSTKEEMMKKFNFREDDYGIDPPCEEMKSIRTSYQESTYDPDKESWATKGNVWIGLVYPLEDFKEISQTR